MLFQLNNGIVELSYAMAVSSIEDCIVNYNQVSIHHLRLPLISAHEQNNEATNVNEQAQFMASLVTAKSFITISPSQCDQMI